MKRKYAVVAILIMLSAGALAKTPVSEDDGATPGEAPTAETPTAVQAPAPVPARSSPTGEKEARKYFNKDQNQDDKADSALRPDEHYLAIHIGGFFSSDSYQWGATNHVSNPGRLQGGVTYRLGPVGRFADLAFRGDFIGYQFPEGNAVNFSLLPMIMFPEATSAFPLYFGIGVGPGVFFQQIANESTLSLNYELVAGVRVFNIVENTGFFMETGIKNEIHLLSDGQFNGYFLSVGAIFVF